MKGTLISALTLSLYHVLKFLKEIPMNNHKVVYWNQGDICCADRNGFKTGDLKSYPLNITFDGSDVDQTKKFQPWLKNPKFYFNTDVDITVKVDEFDKTIYLELKEGTDSLLIEFEKAFIWENQKFELEIEYDEIYILSSDGWDDKFISEQMKYLIEFGLLEEVIHPTIMGMIQQPFKKDKYKKSLAERMRAAKRYADWLVGVISKKETDEGTWRREYRIKMSELTQGV